MDFFLAAPFVAGAIQDSARYTLIVTILALWLAELFSPHPAGVAMLLLLTSLVAMKFLRSFFDASSLVSIVLVFAGGVAIHTILTVVAWFIELGFVRFALLLRALLLLEREMVAGLLLGFAILGLSYAFRRFWQEKTF